MINLELTEDEADSLAFLLGLHAVNSSVNTYPIFSKLIDIIDPDQTRVEFSPFDFTELAKRTELLDNGLFFIRKD